MTNQILESEQVREITEKMIRARVDELKDHLRSLVDRIEVRNFGLSVENSGQIKVEWVVFVPPTLLTLVRSLPDAIKPPE